MWQNSNLITLEMSISISWLLTVYQVWQRACQTRKARLRWLTDLHSVLQEVSAQRATWFPSLCSPTSTTGSQRPLRGSCGKKQQCIEWRTWNFTHSSETEGPFPALEVINFILKASLRSSQPCNLSIPDTAPGITACEAVLTRQLLVSVPFPLYSVGPHTDCAAS